MTNTNTASNQASSGTGSGRRPTSVISPVLNFLGQSAMRLAGGSPVSEPEEIPPTTSTTRGVGSSKPSGPIRVKTNRNKPPDYLSGLFQSGQQTTTSGASEKRMPLYTNLPASAFLVWNNNSAAAAAGNSASKHMDHDTDGDVKAGESNTSPKQKKKLNLPTQWNAKDKNQSLDLAPNGLRITYTGPGQMDAHAAAVRTNYPIPPQCGLFYYEVTIISKGREGFIGIGLCAHNVQLNRLPGWEDHSWGYHGDDGHSFCCSGTGKPYGPCFTTGDVIGCIVNFMTKSISFTKNGALLGTAFPNALDNPKLEGNLYPSIGLRTPGEVVEANFGQNKFEFDIGLYFQEEKARIWHQVNSAPLPPLLPPMYSPTTPPTQQPSINHLILSYLIHHGFCETASAFSSSSISGDVSPVPDDEPFDEVDMRQRQRIRDAILTGSIPLATQLMDQYYPGILSQNRRLAFMLQSQKFVELMRGVGVESNPSEAVIAGEEGEDAMDVDGAGGEGEGHEGGAGDTEEERLRAVVAHGQDLNVTFGTVENEFVQRALVETYSLLAYPDPWTSPVSYLLDPVNRALVADAVNSAILVASSRPGIPAIESIYRQAAVVGWELLKSGGGAAAFVRAEECLV
ncbi:concanavalin A-like lectin/glucanase domain-containing protein [Fimicolochytrium jonesii]|uniref:concanavalin A-like lectin/glucanase domain-containing protein n=1 Tax=Fimicolochytrium jonesii TaxID=1396493 RepID=UPI0022FF1F49|nr:concanavalin A-like lectin/glucanase domain-containing protein [Fimicolochytrium jonesii]KAI8817776.1 concanavalin A-like lectin/glucanase domain-containing protein [Fimicolochytrium jonesii]